MRVRSLGVALLALLVSARVQADDSHLEIPLWPNGTPGSLERKGEQEVKTPRKNGEHSVANVHNPSLTVFLPPKEKATGAAVVIAPGGGHRELWVFHEGANLAKWLNQHGIAAFVLKYRLAREKGSTYQIADHALADGQRAIRLVRSRAKEWGVDPNRVGMLGFSAGGEVTAMVSSREGHGKEADDDPVEHQSSRPAFQALVYSDIYERVNWLNRNGSPIRVGKVKYLSLYPSAQKENQLCCTWESINTHGKSRSHSAMKTAMSSWLGKCRPSPSESTRSFSN